MLHIHYRRPVNYLAIGTVIILIVTIVLYGCSILNDFQTRQNRDLFMRTCTMGDLSDTRLRACDIAYKRHRAVVKNDWKPLNPE